jgi:hypothetical protein
MTKEELKKIKPLFKKTKTEIRVHELFNQQQYAVGIGPWPASFDAVYVRRAIQMLVNHGQ